MNNFIRLKDAAGRFGVCGNSVKNWIKQGNLKALKTPGGHVRIRQTDFEDFINKMKKEGKLF